MDCPKLPMKRERAVGRKKEGGQHRYPQEVAALDRQDVGNRRIGRVEAVWRQNVAKQLEKLRLKAVDGK